MPSLPLPPFLVGFGLLFIAIPLIGIVSMIALIALAVVVNGRRKRMAAPPTPAMLIAPEQPYPPAWSLAMLANQQPGQSGQPRMAPPHHHHQPPMHTHTANPAMHSPPPTPPPTIHH
ncbi:MAG: hypothetical protein ABI068_17435 [Ktedonobacterales bacterium]